MTDRLRAHPWLVGAAACLGLAALSLLVPATSGYDPWAWLVWGREVVRLELDTTGGPSWKPLPVLFTAVLAPTGSWAPMLWLVMARAAGLAGVAGCGVLARRLAGEARGPLAGGVAAIVAGGLLVLTPDDDPRFLRLLLEAHSAPATAALAVWAVERHLAGRSGWALGLGTALALDRPEAWPFVGLYGLWLLARRRDDVPWWAVLGAGAAVPVLWFGGDLWGSGNLVRGAGVAQVYADDPDRLHDALVRVAESVAGPTWALAAVAVVVAVCSRDRAVGAVTMLAVAWTALVVAMSAVLGYAAVGRFLLPSAALVCVLAGLGVARLVGLVGDRWRVGLAAAIVACTLVGSWSRLEALPREARRIVDRERFEDEVALALARVGGPDAVTACRRIVIDEDSPSRSSFAWMLGVPLSETKRALLDRPGVVFDRRGTDTAVTLEASTDPEVRVLARTDGWVVVAVRCPGAGGQVSGP